MATFLQLQTRVRRRVIDAPAAVVAEVPDLINEALRTIQDLHSFRVMETLAPVVVSVTGTRVLAPVPSDFKEFRSFPYRIDFGGRQHEFISAPDRNTVQGSYGTADTGAPEVITVSEPDDLGVRNWEIWPLSDLASDWGDGEYRIYVPYWRYLPPLVADGDTNWFTVNAGRWLIEQAVADAFAVDWDEERMAVWSQRAAGEFKKVVKRDKYAAIAGVDLLVPMWQGANQSRLRR